MRLAIQTADELGFALRARPQGQPGAARRPGADRRREPADRDQRGTGSSQAQHHAGVPPGTGRRSVRRDSPERARELRTTSPAGSDSRRARGPTRREHARAERPHRHAARRHARRGRWSLAFRLPARVGSEREQFRPVSRPASLRAHPPGWFDAAPGAVVLRQPLAGGRAAHRRSKRGRHQGRAGRVRPCSPGWAPSPRGR